MLALPTSTRPEIPTSRFGTFDWRSAVVQSDRDGMTGLGYLPFLVFARSERQARGAASRSGPGTITRSALWSK